MNSDTTPQLHTEVQDQVLEKIRTGEVYMKSKTYFVLKVGVIIVVSILTLLISSLLVSFIFFSVRVSGRLFLLGFGLRGLLAFFLLFPWLLLSLEIVLLIVLERLLKYFKFGYRVPFAYLLLSLALCTIAASYSINFTPLHHILLLQAEQRSLPVIGSLYDHIRRPPQNIGFFRGSVSVVSSTTFVFVEDNDAPTPLLETVLIPPGSHLNNFLHINDRVFVAGDVTASGEIQPYGVRKLVPSDEE